jgi:2-oxoglutarate ferredoxin oxidoreductase subunit delta
MPATKRQFRVSIDRELCKSCELCLPACPRHLLALSAALNRKGCHPAEIARQAECLGCLKCARMCPEAAIEVREAPDEQA